MNYFNYFTEIEETFIRRRGKHLLLSPLDWALIESWQERGIPLKIVLRAIESVFDSVDKNPNQQRTIKNLNYCREEIENQYAEWLESQVGKNQSKEEINESKVESKVKETKKKSTLFSDEVIEKHLANISKLLNEASNKSVGNLAEVLQKVSKKLVSLQKNFQDAESLEEELNKIETLIDKTLLESCDKKYLVNLKSEIKKELVKYKTKMETDVYQRTFDLMLNKKLREKAEIPRISLFYV